MSNMKDTNTLDMFTSTKPYETKSFSVMEVFFDGGCSPNPGQKYGSFEVWFNGEKVRGLKRVQFGHGTNNEAEWNALELALEHAHVWLVLQGMLPETFQIKVETDSKNVQYRLVSKNRIHRKQEYQSASERMFNLASACLDRLKKFGAFTVEWKRRDANVERFGH